MSEAFLRQHLAVTLGRPCAQAVSLVGHVDDPIVHLDDDWRHWCLFSDLYLVDGAAPTSPVVPKFVLSLPICPTPSVDQVLFIQPLRRLRREVKAFL